MATKPDSEDVYQVVESFATLVKGEEVIYTKGEAIHADDPALRRNPAAFQKLDFPHAARRSTTIGAPEIRS